MAESITSSVGDISLTSINGSVAVTKARLNSPNISASSGSITATADAASATITIDGRLNNSPGSHSVAYNGSYTFVTRRSIAAGEELLLRYGAFGNWTMMVDYG